MRRIHGIAPLIQPLDVIIKHVEVHRSPEAGVEGRHAKFVAGAQSSKRRRRQAKEREWKTLIISYYFRPGLEYPVSFQKLSHSLVCHPRKARSQLLREGVGLVCLQDHRKNIAPYAVIFGLIFQYYTFDNPHVSRNSWKSGKTIALQALQLPTAMYSKATISWLWSLSN